MTTADARNGPELSLDSGLLRTEWRYQSNGNTRKGHIQASV